MYSLDLNEYVWAINEISKYQAIYCIIILAKNVVILFIGLAIIYTEERPLLF